MHNHLHDLPALAGVALLTALAMATAGAWLFIGAKACGVLP